MFALVYSRDGRSERHLLTTGDTTVGRAPTCDLVITDPSISRRHARFRVHGDHCLLTDLGGRNGTFRNGELVSETEVGSGDTVTLGRFAFRVQRAEEAGLSLGDHAPELDQPSTICRRLDEVADSGAWRPAVDSGRLFAILPIIARRLLRPHSLSQLHDDIVGAIFDALPADRAFLLMPEPQSRTIVPFVARARDGAVADGSTVSRTIVERVISERVLILATDTLPDANTPTGMGGLVTRTRRWFVCAPLWTEDEPLGALYADSPETVALGMPDLDVMHALALCAGAALQHAREEDRLLSAARANSPPPPTDTPT